MKNKTIEGIQRFKISGNIKRIIRMVTINNIFHIDDKRFGGLRTKQNLT